MSTPGAEEPPRPNNPHFAFEREMSREFAFERVYQLVARAHRQDRVLAMHGLNDSRRKLVSGAENLAIPAAHVRITLHPKIQMQPVAGIERLTVRVPMLVSEGQDAGMIGFRLTDDFETTVFSRELFIEARYPQRRRQRWLVVEEGIFPYSDAADIGFNSAVEEHKHPFAVDPNYDRSIMSQAVDFTEERLIDVLYGYELGLQDNVRPRE